MRNAPPMAPGMPRKNARPAMLASCAARDTFTSGTAVPARTRWSSSILMSENPRPRRITTPGTPPSRTIRFEPSPITVTGMSLGSAPRKYARSSSSSGMNKTCAGPPTRNQVSGASGSFGSSRPRSLDSFCLRSKTMSGKLMRQTCHIVRAGLFAAINPHSSHLVQRRQLTWQRISPLRDVAGAEEHDNVAGKSHPADKACKLLRPVERDDLPMAARAQALHQRVAIGARDRRLARRIDLRDDHRVGVIEAGGEFLEQRGQPRVAVRLHHRDHLPVGRFPRRPQHGGNLHRMVAVIIDNRHAVPLAGAGEAPAHATEAHQRL